MGCGASGGASNAGGQCQTSISGQSKELFQAIQKKDLKQVKTLSEGNPDFPNGTFLFAPGDPGQVTLRPGRMEVSLFITACDGEYGTAEIAKHFLDAKADVNYKTNAGHTALSFACSVDNMLNPDLVQVILDAKPKLGDELTVVKNNRDTRESVKTERGWTAEQVKEAQDRADKVIEALKKYEKFIESLEAADDEK